MNPQQNNNLPTINPSGTPTNDQQSPNVAYSGAPSPTDISPAPLTTPPGSQPSQPNNTPKGSGHDWHSVVSTILLLAIAPLIAFAITAFAVQSYQVDGSSMETTLQNGDRLIVDKWPRTVSRITGHQYVPHRGDIIIFNQANLPDSSFGETKQLIKRVIGLPGEHVIIKNGQITVYNSAHPKGFNPDKTTGYKITAKTTEGDIDLTLNSNQIFVCGDNRPNSEDSRYFGPINTNAVVGKLVLRLLPINKAQKF